MGSSIEDAISRNFTAGSVAERQIPGAERPNAVESTNLRQREIDRGRFSAIRFVQVSHSVTELRDCFAGPVHGTIVDDDDLQRSHTLREHALQTLA